MQTKGSLKHHWNILERMFANFGVSDLGFTGGCTRVAPRKRLWYHFESANTGVVPGDHAVSRTVRMAFCAKVWVRNMGGRSIAGW